MLPCNLLASWRKLALSYCYMSKQCLLISYSNLLSTVQPLSNLPLAKCCVDAEKKQRTELGYVNCERQSLSSFAIVKALKHQRGNVYQQRTSPFSAVFSEIHSGTNSCINLSCSSISAVDLVFEQHQDLHCRQQLEQQKRSKASLTHTFVHNLRVTTNYIVNELLLIQY